LDDGSTPVCVGDSVASEVVLFVLFVSPAVGASVRPDAPADGELEGNSVVEDAVGDSVIAVELEGDPLGYADGDSVALEDGEVVGEPVSIIGVTGASVMTAEVDGKLVGSSVFLEAVGASVTTVEVEEGSGVASVGLGVGADVPGGNP